MVILEDKVHTRYFFSSTGIEGDMLSQIKIYTAFWEDGHTSRFSHPVFYVLSVLRKANPIDTIECWENAEHILDARFKLIKMLGFS